MLLLRQEVAAALHDPRDRERVTHSLRELVAQRLYGLCCGYEDLNDHDRLRHDVLMQTALLACVLRRSRIDGARHAAAVIKLLVQQLRRSWPQVKIVVRGDSGLCRQRLLSWCEHSAVGYVIGLARNARLQAQVSEWETQMRAA